MSSVEGLVDDIHSMCINVCQKRPSIYRVPEHLRKLNENAYTPWHVAVGPYHHRSHKYTIMEEHKMVYTKALICRRRAANNNAQVNKEEIDEYVKEVERLETKSRLNYAEKIEFSKEEFVKMLLIDGCFIVEFLCRKIKILAKFEDEAMKNYDQMYKFINMTYNEVNLKNDFILKSTRTAFEVRRDLTLLENQLPYFVLEKLFDFTFSSKPNRPNFKAIVYCAFRTSIPNISHILNEEDIAQRIQLEPETTAHFVSFLKSCCGPSVGHDEAEAEAEAGDYFTADANIMVDEQRISINNAQDENKKIEFPCLCNMKTHEIRVPSASVLAKSGVLFTKMDG
uniref:Uncharacterized protein n=1 Tax=Chenopodium quinoa TaxID=63459 RepID=A0A803MI06_CHEQI